MDTKQIEELSNDINKLQENLKPRYNIVDREREAIEKHEEDLFIKLLEDMVNK